MDHKKAEADYQRGVKYKDIAEKYGVSLNTVKSWKQRYNWSREKGAHKEKSVHTKKPGAPAGNKNAVGNSGGAAPVGNSNAVTHGFFQKYLPAESFEIMQQIETRSPLDMLWDNIMIQYTAIIRAQQIMFVKDRDDKTIERIERKDSDTMIGEKWEVQQAWDKQASFLQAQSRAMSTLQSLIRQYEDLCRQGQADKEQQLRIAKLKGDIKKAELEIKDRTGESADDPHEQVKSYEAALNAQAEDVFNDG